MSDASEISFEQVIELIHALAAGDLGARRVVTGNDEISAVVAGLNMLAEELEASIGAHRTMSTLVDHSKDFVGMLDHEGTLLMVNRSGLDLAGFAQLPPNTSLSSLFGRESQRIIDGEGVPGAVERGAWQGQLQFAARAGKLEVDVSLFSLGDSPIPRLAVVMRDITAVVRANEDLRRLGAAVDHSDAPIFVTSAAGVIEYVNSAFVRVTGYAREEVIGQNARILKSGYHGVDFYRDFWATISSGNVWSGRFVNRKKSGEAYEEHTTVLPVLNARGKISNYVAVRRDASREVELEAQLRQAQKMEAVGRLAGGIAHEFNNLLAVIQSSADFLASRDVNDEVRSDAEIILRATRRATELTRQLVTFSRKDVLRPAALELGQQVSEMGKMLERLIRADIQMRVDVPDYPVVVRLGNGHLEQILVNMTLNARDAMPEGGMLDIGIERVPIAEVPSAVHWPYERDAALICVADTGQGMTGEMIAHIFEPFFTTKEQGSGTGLGLAVCYGIIRQNGGHVSVESIWGEGTTFRIYFPIASVAVPIEVPVPAREAPQGEEVILLAEDDAEVRAAARRVLQRSGYRILTANNGVEALHLMNETRQRIDLLLTDVIMPVMGGRELADRAREQYPDLKVLFMSGYSSQTPTEPLVQKPFTSEELASMVRATLDK